MTTAAGIFPGPGTQQTRFFDGMVFSGYTKPLFESNCGLGISDSTSFRGGSSLVEKSTIPGDGCVNTDPALGPDGFTDTACHGKWNYFNAKAWASADVVTGKKADLIAPDVSFVIAEGKKYAVDIKYDSSQDIINYCAGLNTLLSWLREGNPAAIMAPYGTFIPDWNVYNQSSARALLAVQADNQRRNAAYRQWLKEYTPNLDAVTFDLYMHDDASRVDDLYFRRHLATTVKYNIDEARKLGLPLCVFISVQYFEEGDVVDGTQFQRPEDLMAQIDLLRVMGVEYIYLRGGLTKNSGSPSAIPITTWTGSSNFKALVPDSPEITRTILGGIRTGALP